MTRQISSTPAAQLAKRHSIASGEMDFADEDESAEVNGGQASSSPSAGRNRSLSATGGEVFGMPSASKRSTTKGEGRGPGSGTEEVE